MEKYNKLKESTMQVNPEFYGLFMQELESIDIKEKQKENKGKNIIKQNIIKQKENANENIVIFISKKEIRTIKKLLDLVDNIMINSSSKK
jgi:hypothetical protein